MDPLQYDVELAMNNIREIEKREDFAGVKLEILGGLHLAPIIATYEKLEVDLDMMVRPANKEGSGCRFTARTWGNWGPNGEMCLHVECIVTRSDNSTIAMLITYARTLMLLYGYVSLEGAQRLYVMGGKVKGCEDSEG